MTAAEPHFIDTNVLVANDQPASRFHPTARATLGRLLDASCELWISRQVIREYLATMTRSVGSNPAPLTHAAAAAAALHLMNDYRLLDEDAAVAGHLLGLISKFRVSGKQVHDANIVATMLARGVPALVTFNVVDFRRYTSLIRIIEPLM